MRSAGTGLNGTGSAGVDSQPASESKVSATHAANVAPRADPAIRAARPRQDRRIGMLVLPCS
jgi:hypothetical protein